MDLWVKEQRCFELCFVCWIAIAKVSQKSSKIFSKVFRLCLNLCGFCECDIFRKERKRENKCRENVSFTADRPTTRQLSLRLTPLTPTDQSVVSRFCVRLIVSGLSTKRLCSGGFPLWSPNHAICSIDSKRLSKPLVQAGFVFPKKKQANAVSCVRTIPKNSPSMIVGPLVDKVNWDKPGPTARRQQDDADIYRRQVDRGRQAPNGRSSDRTHHRPKSLRGLCLFCTRVIFSRTQVMYAFFLCLLARHSPNGLILFVFMVRKIRHKAFLSPLWLRATVDLYVRG